MSTEHKAHNLGLWFAALGPDPCTTGATLRSVGPPAAWAKWREERMTSWKGDLDSGLDFHLAIQLLMRMLSTVNGRPRAW